MQSSAKRETVHVIDLPSLEARCLGSLQLVERILDKLGVQLDADLATLEGAIEAGDTETCRAVAHRLKGMSANVEAWPLHQCAKEAEELARNHEIAELSEQLERFHEMRRQLSTVLKARTLPSKEQSRLEANANRG